MAATFLCAPNVFKVFKVLLLLFVFNYASAVHGRYVSIRSRSYRCPMQDFHVRWSFSVKFQLRSRSMKVRTLAKWNRHGYLCVYLARGKNGREHIMDITISMDVQSNPGPMKNIFQNGKQHKIDHLSSPVNASATLIKYSRSDLLQFRKNTVCPIFDCFEYLKANSIFKFRGKRSGRNNYIPTRISHREEIPNHHSTHYYAEQFNYSTSVHISASNLLRVEPHHSTTGKLSINTKLCLLNTRSVRNKTLIVKDFVVENDFDIIALTETWLQGTADDNFYIHDLCAEGYTFLHTPRPGSRGGGVGLLFRKNLKIKKQSSCTFSSFELIDMLLTTTVKNVRIIVVYRPPPSTQNGLSVNNFFDQFSSLLEQLAITLTPLIIVGDFNFHMDDHNDVYAAKFSTLLDTFGLQQNVSDATHISGHTLDLVITRSEPEPDGDNLLSNFSIQYPVVSDHHAVCFHLSLSRPVFERKEIMYRKTKAIDFDNFTKDLKESTLFTDTPDDLTDLVSVYNSSLKSLLEKYAPVKNRVIIVRPKAPWYTQLIADEKRKRRMLERRWRKNRIPSDRELFVKQSKHVHKLIVNAKTAYYASLIKDNKSDPKVLFKTVHRLLHTGRVNILPNHSCECDLANKFVDKIAKISKSLAAVSTSQGDPLSYDKTCCARLNTFKPVSCGQLSEIIGKNLKSCDSDPIPVFVMKNCLGTLLPVITRIVNLSIETGVMPSEFKKALILPLLKKSTLDPDDLSSFRPISNLPFVSKVIEKVVAVQLNEYIMENKLEEKFQSAYKKFHSTETAIVRVHNDILRAVDSGNSVILLLLDLSAAFDTVNHSILLSRLSTRFGIDGVALSWFRSYLSSRTQFVSINSIASENHVLQCGVPQGSVLGPVLYSMYTSPLGDIAKRHDLEFHFYADDSQLYVIFDPSNISVMQSAKNRIEACALEIDTWMSTNRLKLNKDKTELVIVNSRFRPRPEMSTISVVDELIQPSPYARNIGVIFDQHFTFEQHVNYMCKSAYFHLRNIARIRNCLDESSFKTIVHAFVTSRIDYCNAILYGLPDQLVDKLQHVQNAAARLILNIGKYDHISGALKYLHWLPVKKRITFKLLLLTFKVLNGKAPSYLCDLICKYSPGRSGLRSSSQNLLHIQKTKLKTYGDRSFSVASPKLWNSLPNSIKLSENIDIFKSRLKTFLFKEHFN